MWRISLRKFCPVLIPILIYMGVPQRLLNDSLIEHLQNLWVSPINASPINVGRCEAQSSLNNKWVSWFRAQQKFSGVLGFSGFLLESAKSGQDELFQGCAVCF